MPRNTFVAVQTMGVPPTGSEEKGSWSLKLQPLLASPRRRVAKLSAGWTDPIATAFLRQSLSSGHEEAKKNPRGGGGGRVGLGVSLCFAFVQLEILRKDRPGEPSLQPIPLLLAFFFIRPLRMAGKIQRQRRVFGNKKTNVIS